MLERLPAQAGALERGPSPASDAGRPLAVVRGRRRAAARAARAPGLSAPARPGAGAAQRARDRCRAWTMGAGSLPPHARPVHRGGPRLLHGPLGAVRRRRPDRAGGGAGRGTVTGAGLRRYDAYIFDLDGTIYVDDELIPGADETIARLRADGAQVAFVTNHPLHPATHYAERLTRLGIPAEAAEIVTSVDALGRYLRNPHPG